MSGLRVQVQTPPRFEEVRRRARRLGPVAREVFRTMRFGPGSVARQFAQEREMTRSGSRAWPKTRPFGTRRLGPSTLVATGAYRRAWLGQGAGAVAQVEGRKFRLGVSPLRFPQVLVFQAPRPTRIRAKRRTRSGRLAMQVFLGLRYDVWIRDATLLRGLVVRPRRVAVSARMLRRVGEVLARYVATGRQGRAA